MTIVILVISIVTGEPLIQEFTVFLFRIWFIYVYCDVYTTTNWISFETVMRRGFEFEFSPDPPNSNKNSDILYPRWIYGFYVFETFNRVCSLDFFRNLTNHHVSIQIFIIYQMSLKSAPSFCIPKSFDDGFFLRVNLHLRRSLFVVFWRATKMRRRRKEKKKKEWRYKQISTQTA